MPPPKISLKQFLMVLLVLIASWPIHGLAIELQAGMDRLNPASAVEFIEDSNDQLTLAAILTDPSVSARFKPAPISGRDINFGYSSASYWLRVPLKRESAVAANAVLELMYIYIDRIEFYAPGKAPVITGSAYPFNTHPIANRFYAFPIELSTQSQYFYFRIQSEDALTVPLALSQLDKFSANSQQDYMLQSFYYGGVLALALYNLLLYFSLKDKTYLFYSLYVITLGLGMLAGNGFGKQLLWPDFPAWNRVSQSTILSVTSVFAILFAQSYLQTQRQTPKTHVFLNLLMAAFSFVAVSLALSVDWGYPIAELLNAMLVLSVLFGCTMIVTPIRLIYNGQRGYRYFLLAWGILSLGVMVATFRFLDWLPTNAFTAYAVQISSAFEMLFLAFALADRIHQETQLKQQSQEEALKLKQSLLKTLAISERNLEKQVKERTLALETSLANEKQIRIQYIRFGALISHEFRNQLAIIRSQLSVIDKEYQQGIVALEKRIPIINLTINRLTSLFDKWLQDGRLNDDNHVLVIDRIDVTAWLSDLIEQYKTLQPEHAFIIKFNSEVTELFADVELLTMAVKNLIDNACKYSPADSLITIEVRQQDRMVGIAVIDHGLGIAEQHQHQIFSDYYRVNPESVIQGLGLGLSLVKRIINRHGGHIELTSVLGNGSCFCLWLKHNRDAYADSTI